MNPEEETFEFFKALAHPYRIRIIELLHEDVELSYSEMLTALQIETGPLNFHLKSMGELWAKRDDKYVLSDAGELAFRMIQEVRRPEKKTAEPVKSFILKRLTATLIDFALFLGGPALVALLTSVWVPFYRTGISAIEVTFLVHSVLFLTFLTFTAMETYNGQTLGKYYTGIRVLKEDGRKINLTEGAIRNVAKVYFLPLDVLAGLLLYRKYGYIRFSDYYIKARIFEK